MANKRKHERRSTAEWKQLAEEFLSFDVSTGMFTWKKESGRAKVGKLISYNGAKYLSLSLAGKKIYAHELVLILVKGIRPSDVGMVTDHLNHDTHDNRPENLEIVIQAENLRRTKERMNGKRLYISPRCGRAWEVQVPCGNRKEGRYSKKKTVRSLEAALLYRALFQRVGTTLEQDLTQPEVDLEWVDQYLSFLQ